MSSIEFAINDKLINWQAWILNNKITPLQAAMLAHCLDPIVWEPKIQGIPKPLSIKIRQLEMVLSSEKQQWSLVLLVPTLNRLHKANTTVCDGVPQRMRTALNSTTPKTLNTYEKRKADAENYINQTNLKVETLTTFNFHKLLKTQNSSLWTVEHDSFVKHFWTKFATEKGIEIKLGRPPRQKIITNS